MNAAAVRGIVLEISKSPHLRPICEPQDVPWLRTKWPGLLVTGGYGAGKTWAILSALRNLQAFIRRTEKQSHLLRMTVLVDKVHFDLKVREMLEAEVAARKVPDIAFYCRTPPDRWSVSQKQELEGELDSTIAFVSLLAPPSPAARNPPEEGKSDPDLQLARERRNQLLARESWIDAPAVHLQQGGRADSQGINNTASRLRRAGELLGAWNGREYLHPTFQFHPDTGMLMPQMKILLGLLPEDRSGWRPIFWLFQPHGQLDGSRPADVFRSNPQSVIDAARSDFEISDERW